MSDLHDLSIAEAGRLLRNRQTTSVELAEACLARIGAIDSRLNASRA